MVSGEPGQGYGGGEGGLVVESEIASRFDAVKTKINRYNNLNSSLRFGHHYNTNTIAEWAGLGGEEAQKALRWHNAFSNALTEVMAESGLTSGDAEAWHNIKSKDDKEVTEDDLEILESYLIKLQLVYAGLRARGYDDNQIGVDLNSSQESVN